MRAVFSLALFAGMVLFPALGEARTDVFIGANFGYPGYYRPYRPYYSPRVYYAPPPVYYTAPPPVYYGAPPVTPDPACRTFRGDASVDASGQPFFGIACLRADGRWHIQGP
jgi:hypothetical protein